MNDSSERAQRMRRLAYRIAAQSLAQEMIEDRTYLISETYSASREDYLELVVACEAVVNVLRRAAGEPPR